MKKIVLLSKILSPSSSKDIAKNQTNKEQPTFNSLALYFFLLFLIPYSEATLQILASLSKKSKAEKQVSARSNNKSNVLCIFSTWHR